MKRLSVFFVVILLLSTILVGCNKPAEEEASSPSTEKTASDILQIYTTLFPLEDFTKKIGGAHVDVINIVPPGANEHTFEPTSKTMVSIAEGDAFIYNGLGLETYAEKVKEAIKDEKTLIVEAGVGIDLIEHHHEKTHDNTTHEGDMHASDNEATHEEEHGHEDEETPTDEHSHGDTDPHVWLDPIRAITLAENIKNTLVELKPEAKEEFEANFVAVKADLEALDKEFHDLLAAKENPKILVSHAAFGYWEEVYGIEQIAVTGLSASEEPSQQDLQNLVDTATENDIKYVIFEQNVTPKIAEVIRNEIKAESLRLHNLSVLTEEDIQANEDYFTLMRANLAVLDKAL